jgi:hypothetical protein
LERICNVIGIGLESDFVHCKVLLRLCPRLQSLQIEGQDPSVEPELIPILKDIVTLRVACGSPLEDFTFFNFQPEPGSKIELIGRDKSFKMEVCVLDLEEFELDIEFAR